MARKAALLRVFLICLVMSLLRHNAVFAVLPAVLAAAVFAVGLTLSDQAARMRSLQEEEAALRSQVEELQSERARLMHMIDYAGTDAYVEQIARGTLGWVKEGETRYVFED